jgi:hypothetical protein
MKKFLAGALALAAVFLAVPAGTTNAQTDATIMLLHGIPGVPVDVVVDGAIVIENFKPGDMQDLSAFAGQTLKNLEVRLTGTDTVAIGPVASFPVPASGNYTVVAHLDADGKPTLTPFENDTKPVGAGQGVLIVRHTAAAPAVDLVVGEDRPVENAANGDSASLTLPAGEIAGAKIAPTGGDPIADVPTVTLKAGTALAVYAVGSLEDDTFTFYTQEIPLDASTTVAATQTDGTPSPTAVNTGGETPMSSNSVTLFAAAAGLFAFAGGALVLRRRTVGA